MSLFDFVDSYPKFASIGYLPMHYPYIVDSVLLELL